MFYETNKKLIPNSEFSRKIWVCLFAVFFSIKRFLKIWKTSGFLWRPQKLDKIFPLIWRLLSKFQNNWNISYFCDLLRKPGLYPLNTQAPPSRPCVISLVTCLLVGLSAWTNHAAVKVIDIKYYVYSQPSEQMFISGRLCFLSNLMICSSDGFANILTVKICKMLLFTFTST